MSTSRKKSGMRTAHWSQQCRDEHAELVRESYQASPEQPARTAHYLQGVKDAEQAGRPWAKDILAEAEWNGVAQILKSEHNKNNLVPVSIDGQVLRKHRTVGTKTRTSGGGIVQTQMLFDYMTLEDLRAKQLESVTQAKAYTKNAAMYGMLIALCEAGSADTPADAAANLGTTVESWLIGGAAA